jgi:hypothetical protein
MFTGQSELYGWRFPYTPTSSKQTIGLYQGETVMFLNKGPDDMTNHQGFMLWKYSFFNISTRASLYVYTGNISSLENYLFSKRMVKIC